MAIHLAPSRLGQVAIDSFYRVDGATGNTAIFGGRTIEFVLKTSSLLPAAGLNFNLDGQVYHMAYGATELSIPYEIATNTTRYPRAVTPVLTIEEPQYLLGEALPSISSMIIKDVIRRKACVSGSNLLISPSITNFAGLLKKE